MYIYLSLLSISNLEQEKLESLVVEDFSLFCALYLWDSWSTSVPQSQKCSSSYLAPNTPFCCSRCFHHSLPLPCTHTSLFCLVYTCHSHMSRNQNLEKLHVTQEVNERHNKRATHVRAEDWECKLNNGSLLPFPLKR